MSSEVGGWAAAGAGGSRASGGAGARSPSVWAAPVLRAGAGGSSASGGAGARPPSGSAIPQLRAGTGGSSSSDGAAAAAPAAGWIDPDLLEVKFQDSVCALCFGVMLEPSSGCPEGHCFCRGCFATELRARKRCPTCRHAVAGEQALVRIRPLAGMISQLRMRCQHAEAPSPSKAVSGSGHWTKGDTGQRVWVPTSPNTAGGGDEAAAAGPPAAKRAKLSLSQLAPAASATEEDGQKDAGCKWRGSVGGHAAHVGECGWAPVKCLNEGCTESPLRKVLLEHKATCEHRVQKCGHCATELKSRLLAEHEGSCPEAVIGCPNEGCSREKKRGSMDLHRARCKFEEVSCLCPGCDARLLRKGMDAHVEATHMHSAGKQLQSLWHEVATLKASSESEVARLTERSEREVAALEAKSESKVATLKATAQSEHCHAGGGASSWVFNWRAAGWGSGEFHSETHQLGDGVTGSCSLKPCSRPEHSHHIGLKVEGRAKCMLHATLSILDKHDQTLRKVQEFGTSTTPKELDFALSPFWGGKFTPTDEEQEQSVRADGSIRLRAVVRLFLDSAA
ncbi:hypothetical protein T484DRAFT_1776215 [Baffinella frigidus]|nr:hypothetical protein T484DRAFT_1776215 [Cryptophyta sp. CCMP2293]